MKILHANHCLSIGGAEVMIIDLAREQQEMGHAVTICSMYGEATLDERARALGLKLIIMNTSRSCFAQLAAIRTLLMNERFDIVHMHWGVWFPVAVACRIVGVPCVYTNHSQHSRRSFLQHRIAARCTNKIVALTPVPDPYIQSWVGVPISDVEVIPNGVDISRFATAEPCGIQGIPDTAVVVGMVGRMCAPKDHETFIRASKTICETNPGVYCVSIGDGPDRKRLELLVAQLDIPGFHFLGSRSDVPALLRRMSVNVLSTRNEGLPIAILEAMAGGCAVVASDIPPIRFILESGRCGLLVPVGDANALADAVIGLLGDENRREGLVESGSDRVREFSSRRMAERYLALYGTVGAQNSIAGTPA